MKLKAKVNLFTTAVATLILGISFIIIYFLYENFAMHTEYEQLLARTDDLASAINSLDSASGIDTLIRAYMPSDGYIVVRDGENNTIIRMQATSNPLPELEDSDDAYEIKSIGNVDHLMLTYPVIWPEDGIANVTLLEPIPHVAQNLTALRWILAALFVLAIIPIYLASNFLSRVIIQPIASLTKTMQQNIVNQTYEQIETPTAKDEIAEMARAYNLLMESLEQSYLRQQQFIGNASHELKTPLTVIESYASLLKRRGVDNAELTNEALDAILSESDSMRKLIEQMLQLAKSSEALKLDIQLVELDRFLNDIALSLERSFGVPISVESEKIAIDTDATLLQQLLIIFIDNARKYSVEGSSIAVKAFSKNSSVAIQIVDHGFGIPKEDLPHLFERFYRVTKDRNRKTGGAGLGLAIASELAKNLHANLTLDSELGVGTTITITLPLKLEVIRNA